MFILLSNPARTLLTLRFCSYCAAHTHAFLTPLLIFLLTGSSKVAGLLILAEWLPKIALYLYGGAWVDRLGSFPSFIATEAAKFLGLLLLLLVSLALLPWPSLFIIAPIFQMSNALSNIIFERSAHFAVDSHHAAALHSRLLSISKLSGLAILGLGLIGTPAWILALFSLTMATLTLLLLLHPLSQSCLSWGRARPTWEEGSLRLALKALSVRDWQQALLSIGVGFPAMVIFLALPFILQHWELQDLAPIQTQQAFVALLMLILVGFFLQFMARLQEHAHNVRWMTFTSIATGFLGCFLMLIPVFWIQCFAFALLCFNLWFFLGWHRKARQQSIVQFLPAHLHNRASGILIADEAVSAVLASLFLIALGHQVPLLIASSCLPMLVALLWGRGALLEHFWGLCSPSPKP